MCIKRKPNKVCVFLIYFKPVISHKNTYSDRERESETNAERTRQATKHETIKKQHFPSHSLTHTSSNKLCCLDLVSAQPICVCVRAGAGTGICSTRFTRGFFSFPPQTNFYYRDGATCKNINIQDR